MTPVFLSNPDFTKKPVSRHLPKEGKGPAQRGSDCGFLQHRMRAQQLRKRTHIHEATWSFWSSARVGKQAKVSRPAARSPGVHL